MENQDIMKYLPQIILAIGAIIGIIAFFIEWYSITIDGEVFKYTGKEFLDHADGKIAYFAPLIILILGIVALIVSAIPLFGVQLDGKILNAIVAVVGIVAIIFFIVYATYTAGEVKFGEHLAIGAWLGLISALIPVIVGALGFFDVFEKIQ